MDNEEYIQKFKELELEFPEWIVGVVPDADVGLGISYLWQFPIEHPLHYASVIHDLEYQVKLEQNSKASDYRLLKNFIKQSNGNTVLIGLSYIFYILASIWGKISWNNKPTNINNK